MTPLKKLPLPLSVLFLALTLISPLHAQSPQQAFSSYSEYSNRSGDEVAAVASSLINYYPDISRIEKDSWRYPRYTCPIQPEPYYFNKALTDSKAFDVKTSGTLNTQLRQLQAAATKVQTLCRSLDTYHKLEDYKRDNFAEARELIKQLLEATAQYRKQQNQFSAALTEANNKRPAVPAYTRADGLMQKALKLQRAFLDTWSYNLNEDVPTASLDSPLAQTIMNTAALHNELKESKIVLKYPASSQWDSFVGSVWTMLEVLRNGQDGYNYEARKSDRYTNAFYKSLINQYNGGMVAFYNAFLDYAVVDNMVGVKAMRYVPAIEIRTQPFVRSVTVVPFQDVQHKTLNVAPQAKPIATPVFEALKNYVQYIDETWRQTTNLRNVINNFASSALYYKGLDDYSRTGGLQFNNKDFKIPLSAYQQAVAASKALPPLYAQALNQQAGVLQDIMREFYALSALLEEETRSKRYEKDHVGHIYTVLERHAVLFNAWNDRKEQLYTDIRAIFDAYPPAAPTASWYISGKALRNLTDLDHDAVFKARRYYTGDSSITIAVQPIRQALRDVISAEYDNMKGIEKIGRNNGSCPYSPYEDLPQHSQTLADALEKLKPAQGKEASSYDHPYHTIVYRYNEIVENYNKFSSLSRVPLLPTVHQPELFALPSSKPQRKQPTAQREPQQTPNEPPVRKRDRQQDRSTVPVQQQPKERVIRDTVYIERRDTVYLPAAGEDLRSMEGYAINHMVLLLDVSGSMETPEKLPLLKESVLTLMTMMRPEDKVSIIAFSGKPKVLLESGSFRDEGRLRKAIEALKSSGKTDGDAGLKLAYSVADENYLRGGNNRILLATDGEFPLSTNTLELIQKFAGQDIFLSVFNFGKSPHAAQKLGQLADRGHGNYIPINRQNIESGLIREAKSKKKAQ